MKDVRVVVIADDLTGALDTGVQFSKWGLPVQVHLSLESLSGPGSTQTVTVEVFNTESREDPPEIAVKKIKRIFSCFEYSDNCIFYKKIDSTLRGNIGVELDTLMCELGVNHCFLAPAYPEQHRTTHNGVHLIKGVKISETEYFNETKLVSSTLTSLIEIQTNRKTHHINLGTLRNGTKNLRALIENLIIRGVEIISFDAVTNEDLLEVVRVSEGIRILCGSAGLASQIPGSLGFATRKPILTICGSTRSTSLNQIRKLVQEPTVRNLSLNTLKILNSKIELDKEVERVAFSAAEFLDNGYDVAISSVSDINSFNNTITYGKKRGIPFDDIKQLVSETLSMIVSSILSLSEVSGLILTGGDTAQAVYSGIGTTSVELIGEFQPGIPLLKLPMGIRSITKAGGFGTENTLIEAVNFLKMSSSWRDL